MSDAFSHIPRTARGHFLLNFYAAVDRLLHYLHRLSEVGGKTLDEHFQQYPFLAGYFAEMRRCMPAAITWEQTAVWWQSEIESWEAGVDGHLPLRALALEADVGYASRIAWLLSALVDEDSRFGTLFAHLQEPLAYRRPCLETLGQMMAVAGWIGGAEAWKVCRSLIANGLVEVTNRDMPHSEWVLRVPTLLWDVARGEIAPQPAAWCRHHARETFPTVRALIFPTEFLLQLEQAPALLSSGQNAALILRGMQGSERLEVCGAVARALGRALLEVPALPVKHGEGGDVEAPYWPLLGPLCTLAHSLPVLHFDLGPGETVELPVPPGYHGPVGILLGFEGGLRGPLAENALTFTLPAPKAEQRLRHWQQALAGRSVVDLTAIGERFHLPGGYIRQAGGLAIAQAALHGREAIQLEDVRQACRTLNRQLLDSLATRLDAEGAWDRLVASETTFGKLLELEQRCRHRERLSDHLGPAFGRAHNRGVRALFTGASGTGKTLAARILAAELSMDIYRVDLSAVINKYIGETEKNLHRVLSRAEELDVVLLLDEGDTLLGNRTEVKSSNDRYANLETNYLLQRLEHFQGIVLVTTNAGQMIDSAFQRRMDVIVQFVPPDASERLSIWQLHLPANHQVDSGYLMEVAVRCALTGGQIRNAALHAALLALDDGSYAVTRYHLEAALQSEYRKAGALDPLSNGSGDYQPQRGQNKGAERFINALASGAF